MKAVTDEGLARLRKALSEEELRCAPGGCPSKEALWESAAGELDSQENEAIVLHLARCSECSSIWRLARELLPAAQISTSTVVSLQNRKPSHARPGLLVPAIAATMLIGVGLGAGWILTRNPPSPPVFRQQQDVDTILAAPETHLLPRAACRLEWSAGPEGALYDLVATDERLEILASVKGLRRPEYTVPRETIPPSARNLYWRVTTHLPDGRVVSSRTFTSRIADSAPAHE
jgi:hypothetical protein